MKNDSIYIKEIKRHTLVLTQTNPKTDIMFNDWINNGIKADIIFKSVPKPLRAIRRFWMNIPLPFFFVWLGHWKDNIGNYDTVILHASEWTRHIPKYIHKLNPSIRIIYWYWNPVNELSSPYKVSDKNVEFWSFDEDDCKKYCMKKNIQYYNSKLSLNKKIKYDIYFVGHNKGRKDEINSFFSEVKKVGISYKSDFIEKSEDFIPYEEVRKRILNCKAILELNQKGQTGLTLRAMESLFFEKKLITNNKSIINYPFYNTNNIFIIGKDNFSTLKNFIDSRYDESVNTFKSDFDIDSWLTNFFARRD